MFTRTNIAIALLIFLVSFSVLSLVFGEHGLIARRDLQEERDRLLYSVERKGYEVDMLRSRAISYEDYLSEELVLPFPDEPFVPSVDSVETLKNSYIGLSKSSIILFSLIPVGIYILAIILVRRLRKEYRGG